MKNKRCMEVLIFAFLVLTFCLPSAAIGESVEQTVTLNNFSAGELSPLVQAQVKLPFYIRGAKTLENMLPRIQGPITRRPGTKFIASVKDADDETRLFPFELSTEFAYMIESGDEYARFYRVGAQITVTYSAWTTTTGYAYGDLVTDSGSYYRCLTTHTSGTFATDLAAGKWEETGGATDLAYEIATPWDESDVFEVQFAQNSDTMRLVHPDYEPYKLTRTGHAIWTCEPINSETGPFLAQNTDKAFTIAVDNTGDASAYDFYKVNDDSDNGLYSPLWLAQTFQASDTYTAVGVKIKIWRTNLPGTVTVSIRATSASKPSGADLAVGTTNGNTLPSVATGEWREITFASGTAITSGTTYAIVVRATGGNLGNRINWRSDSSSPSYTNGSYAYSANSGTSWTLNTSVDFMFRVVADGVNSSETTLEASADLFDDPGHIGALFQISHSMEAESVSKQFWTNGDSNSTSITIQKYRYYDVLTSGLWKGTFKIQRSYDDGSTWEDVYSVAYNWNGNIQFAGQELEETCLYRMAMRDQYVTNHNFRNNEAFCDGNLNARGFINNGVVEILTVTDANTATGSIKTLLGSTDATWRWSEGAWSDYRGWPRTIEHHEGRVIYGGSASYPQTIWASIIAEKDSDYDDFTANTESDVEGNLGGPDDVAWTYILPGKNPIQWMKSADYLMVGTTSGVGKFGQPDKPITPNFPPTYRTQNYNGCAYQQPAEAVDTLLYVERGAEKVRELAFTFSRDKFVAPDMTVLAEHIAREGDGIVQTTFQARPDPVLWCVRADGQLLSFTYHRNTEAMAWARHDTGAAGLFKSAAAIPGSAAEDELWAVVGRTVDSTTVKYVEQVQPWDWGTDQNDCYFVDSGTTSLTELDHLEGLTVALWADGRSIGTYTVALGEISPSGSYTNTTIGLPYTSVYETMPLVVQQRNGEFVNALSTGIRYILVDFYKTHGCSVGVAADKVEDFEFGMSTTETVDIVTDYREGPTYWGTKRAPTLYFTETEPGPMTIRSVNAKVEVEFE